MCLFGDASHIGRVVIIVTASSELASQFLPAVAATPFDGNDGTATNAWVTSVLPDSRLGTVLQKTTAAAVYKVYGFQDRAVLLDIESPQFDAWMRKK